MKLTVCPCCGLKFEGDLRAGCSGCGARAVGAPLAQPEHRLPTFGRALFVLASGAAMLALLLIKTLLVLIERAAAFPDLWSVVLAAETAAWRLKWIALPLAVLALWSGARICRSLRVSPARFAGRRLAHGGLAVSVLATLLIATLIGITVPERWRWRQRGIEAATLAQSYALQRALLEYRVRYKTLPATLDDLRRLPDPDGSIAAVIASIDFNAYKSWSVQARLPEAKSRARRGTVMRSVSLASAADDALDEGVSFTNYEMRLPGEDKILNTADDWILRDGITLKPSESMENTPRPLSAVSDRTP